MSMCVDVCRRVATLLYLCVCRRVPILRVLCPCCADPQSAVPTQCRCSQCCAHSMPICVYLQSAVTTQCRSSECCAYTVPIYRVLYRSSECCADPQSAADPRSGLSSAVITSWRAFRRGWPEWQILKNIIKLSLKYHSIINELSIKYQ